jgi:hypothetical protein
VKTEIAETAPAPVGVGQRRVGAALLEPSVPAVLAATS